MKHLLILFYILSFIAVEKVDAITISETYMNSKFNAIDTTRIVELNAYWVELARTVKEGDYEGYAAAYHDDAVVIFASGKNKVSMPISQALANWKQGFIDTRNGKKQDSVEFRFSQRIGDETTAHETGIFHFQSSDKDGNATSSFAHFEMLFVKQNNKWLSLMEYQKSNATLEEWEALQ